ncbi:MAG: M50 family metallopeptidase [Candidatus Komeilibacteria bacterium]|nr:M50 family metallopeptidase [Candidatus Komeilibacteria bacterium]
MTIGIYIIIILALGYISVYIRERWLNLKWMMPLTWLGIFIHESAHALACVISGGQVTGFRVTSREGYVTHYRPKVPVIGPMVTAIAPMIFGLIIMGILNHFWLKTSLGITSINIWDNFVKVVSNLNPLTWSGWILLIIFLNIGVMMGPSVEDLKNIWPLVLLSFFIHSESLAKILALVIALIIVNILLFLLILLVKYFLQRKRPNRQAYGNN